MLTEIIQSLIVGVILSLFGLFILGRWIDDTDRQNREIASKHQIYAQSKDKR